MNPVDVLKANEGAVVRAGLTLVAGRGTRRRPDRRCGWRGRTRRADPNGPALEEAAIAVRAETREE